MTPPALLDPEAVRSRFAFAALVQPLVGLLDAVGSLPQGYGEPVFEIACTALNSLTRAFPHIVTPSGLPIEAAVVGGAGADPDPEPAWVRAVAEGAERYAMCVHLPEEFVIASQEELGPSALDLVTVPRLSDREYADARCPLKRPDPRAPIRWVRGHSLTEDCERLVPAIMTHLYLRPWEGESFWIPISTGVAAHTDLATALVSAICEVIERDAVALTWLGRLPLPRIDLEGELPAPLVTNLDRLRRSMVRQLFFDATTDLGIPTVYTVQLRDEDPRAGQIVDAATDFDPALACAKTIREGVAVRSVFQNEMELPEKVEDFAALEHGARYLGRSERRAEFQFLLGSQRLRSLASMRIDAPSDATGRLAFLLDRLKRAGMETVAVDLTTDEIREAGLWVVRVVIPGLMPMSTVWRARYLGHPRLYEYPERAGYGRLCEADVNPAPQPFA